MQDKVKNDIKGVLLTVRQGYLHHIIYCNNLLATVGSETITVGDGMLPQASKEAHIVYVNELEELLRTIGINPLEEFIQPIEPPPVVDVGFEPVGQSVNATDAESIKDSGFDADTTLVKDIVPEIPPQ